MFYIVETKEQLENLRNIENTQECYLDIIPYNDLYHNKLMENNISLIYLRFKDGYKGYIICLNHSESLNINVIDVLSLINNINKIYVLNKKKTLYYLPQYEKNIIDLNTINNLYKNIEIEYHNNTISYFYNKFSNLKEINLLIPITKIYEQKENEFKIAKKLIDKHEELEEPELKEFNFYNNEIIPNLFKIERNGIKLNQHYFLKSYIDHKDQFPLFIAQGKIYSQYNIYTTTSRPSNSYKGINFLAINKKNEDRNSFIPENDYFIELDFDSYHIRLICSLLNYKFEDESIHSYFASLYFNKTEITNEEYSKSKEITFSQIYGNILKEYENIPFFKLLKEYINKIWKEFNKYGYIICDISGKMYFKDKMTNPSPTKIFNYIIQNLETSNNILNIKEINNILENKKSKIVLYNYDSYLLDVNKEEEEEILTKIKNQIKYPLKINKGKSYYDLEFQSYL